MIPKKEINMVSDMAKWKRSQVWLWEVLIMLQWQLGLGWEQPWGKAGLGK